MEETEDKWRFKSTIVEHTQRALKFKLLAPLVSKHASKCSLAVVGNNARWNVRSLPRFQLRLLEPHGIALWNLALCLQQVKRIQNKGSRYMHKPIRITDGFLCSSWCEFGLLTCMSLVDPQSQPSSPHDDISLFKHLEYISMYRA